MEEINNILRGKGVVLNESELAAVLSKLRESDNNKPTKEKKMRSLNINTLESSGGDSYSMAYENQYQQQQLMMPQPPPSIKPVDVHNSPASQKYFGNKNEPSPLKRRLYDPNVTEFDKKDLKPEPTSNHHRSRTVGHNAALVIQKNPRSNIGVEKTKRSTNYEKQIAALKAPTTAAENHKFGKKTALEYSATVVQRHVRGMLARRFMKSQRGKTNTTNRLFNDSLVKEKDFLKWGQPKDQNSKTMKKVKYDYIPPFGTDIQILEVMSKTTSNKLNKAMGKIKTVNGMFGGALANLVNTKIAGINNNNMNGNLDGTYDVLPTSNYEKVDNDVNFFVGHENSKFLNGTTHQRSLWNSSRKHIGDEARSNSGVDPNTGEFRPIYKAEEHQYLDSASSKRTPWSTTKRHFTFDEKNLPYERNGSMDGKSIICAISQPSEQSDTFYASSKLKAPWSTKRKMVNENNVAQSDHVDFARGTGGTYGGNNGTFIPYDPNAAYYKKVIQPVLSPTEALYGPAKESIKRQYTRRFHDTSQVLNPKEESPTSKKKPISPRLSPTEGRWWTENTYADNIGAKPNQWKTTYERNSEGHNQLSPRRAAHFAHLKVAKHPSTYDLSEQIHNSPRVQNARNRKEYHKAKDWFNSIRKPEKIAF